MLQRALKARSAREHYWVASARKWHAAVCPPFGSGTDATLGRASHTFMSMARRDLLAFRSSIVVTRRYRLMHLSRTSIRDHSIP